MNSDCKAKKCLSVLGVIPARGASKRLPRKNIKLLNGQPLISYTITAAKRSKLLSDFLVSSEDDEILEIAKSCGAPVYFKRPKKLSGDNIRNIETVYHALTFMEEKKGIRYDIVILLQPTSPIRNPDHIDEAIMLLQNSNLDTVVSVKGPFKKRDAILKAIRGEILEDYCKVANSNKREPFYLYNAALYAAKRNYFVKNKKLISDKQIPIVMDQFHSIDIDTESDFLIADAFLKHLDQRK